ncbi:MAG: AMP-binding protein [Victivallales bacterium]|nr:AMP-binding protein [Victivallales bacterium]
MLDTILILFFWLCAEIAVRIRYRVKLVGLDEIIKKYGRKGLLFCPNHPALIDPLIMTTMLWGRFRPRALVIDKQIKEPPLKYIWKRIRLLPLPDIGATGMRGHDMLKEQIGRCVDALKAGDNLLFYPAGRIYRSSRESLRGNGGLAAILQEYPDAKLVLVRTTGLWGSDFGRAKGYQTPLGKTMLAHLKHIFYSGIFFMPRRHVTIEFFDKPADLPAPDDKRALNHYLEEFYNQAQRQNTYVRYTWKEEIHERLLPEAEWYNVPEDTTQVPDEIRAKVKGRLHELTGKRFIRDTDTLVTDLALSDEQIQSLYIWLQREFRHPMPALPKLRTVASLMIAAAGIPGEEPFAPIPPAWFRKVKKMKTSHAKSLTVAFLHAARRHSGFPMCADQESGVFNGRRMIQQVVNLYPTIKRLPGKHIALMLPPSAKALLTYLACAFAGKIPVMLNWSLGNAGMKTSLAKTHVHHILTTKQFSEALKAQGVDFSGIVQKFVDVDKLIEESSRLHRIWARIASHCDNLIIRYRALKVSGIAAIYFVPAPDSGEPRQVVLKQHSVIHDIRDILAKAAVTTNGCVLAMQPLYQISGLLNNLFLPCISNLRVVFHPNPDDATMLARVVAGYAVTHLAGAPAYINSILKAGTSDQLHTLQTVVCNAETCPTSTTDLLHEKVPSAKAIAIPTVGMGQ